MSGGPPAVFSPGGLPLRRPNNSLGSIPVSNATVTIVKAKVAGSPSGVGLKTLRPPRFVRLSLEMVTEGSGAGALRDVPFKVSVAHGGEITLSSKEQQTPWKFLIRISSERKQMSVSFTLNYAGLGIDQALEALAFYDALVNGGKLQIHGRHPLTGKDLPIVSAAIPSGAYPNPDIRLVETLERLAFIEKKTGVSFSIPPDDITYEVANTIAATAHILETGRADYKAQPWVSVSPIEQAKVALETFASGRPAPMAIHFQGQVVVIFGTDVMLGPVTLFCDRTYITAEDLEELRKQLQNAKPHSTIEIRFTPFEDCPIEARYVNWLPDHEAAAIRQLPMYQQEDVLGNDESWSLPNVDVSKAVSLLESWYDEDAEEQKTSWKLIKSALERDRLSDRKLFP